MNMTDDGSRIYLIELAVFKQAIFPIHGSNR